MRQTIILVLFLFSSCVLKKHLVYFDDWEGVYVLERHDCCGTTQTNVKMLVEKINPDNYSWQIFYPRDNFKKDTIFGKANYRKKKLEFFLSDASIAQKFFVGKVAGNEPIFHMEYDNYYSDAQFKHIGRYTRWNNDLINYRQQNKFAAGVNFHFKKINETEKKIERKKHY